MSRDNFDRQYRLIAGKAGSTGFEIGAATKNQPVPLHIAFSVEKSEKESANTAKVDIWNLNKEHLSVLETKDCCVAVRAGYGDRLSLIFSGIVTTCTTEMDQADRKTSIELVDNLVELRDTYVSVSYSGKVSWKKIFDDVAAQMGVAISYAYDAKFIEVANGFSFVGKAKDILSKGCNCCKLSWSLQNGVLQVKRPGGVMSNEVYVLSAETGLLGTPARVNESASESTSEAIVGWDVEYLMNGAIHVDDFVKLESKAATGFFRVYSVSIDGDNVSGDWMCKARLKEVSPS